jgi:hypothetical protein
MDSVGIWKVKGILIEGCAIRGINAKSLTRVARGAEMKT